MEASARDVATRQPDISQFMLDDLQLAAELGKTLLERNKELEIILKEYKNKSEEQEREILHLNKHINAMTEVNDSRLKVYEQLEAGIQDLELTNKSLNLEKCRDKKQIKSLTCSIETLEARCDELTQLLNECRQSLNAERRKNDQLQQERCKLLRNNEETELNVRNLGFTELSTMDQFSYGQRNVANSTGVSQLDDISVPNKQLLGDSMSNLNDSVSIKNEDNEVLVKLVSDLESMKRDFLSEQQRCGELEEQLIAIIQENQSLQSRLVQTSANEEMMSMHDEFSLLEDVRQGQMCIRCLRVIDEQNTNNDEQSSIAQTEEMDEEDERSLIDLESQRDRDIGSDLHLDSYNYGISNKENFRASGLPDSPNPYRDLVEKYEALLEVQRSSIAIKTMNSTANNAQNIGNVGGSSLAKELNIGGNKLKHNFMMQTALDATQETVTSISNDSKDVGLLMNGVGGGGVGGAGAGRTPTEYSEAETSSSGYSDETSNKYTQTDERPGFFLCSISDGEDCKFSIYDDVSPIDSHFRNRPEYKELFKEIFGVLKKAAENKEEGEKLPLLDDEHQTKEQTTGNDAKVPPVTPTNEDQSVDFADDTQSIISSAVSDHSFAISECVTKLERKTAKKHINETRAQAANCPPIMTNSASTAQLSSYNKKSSVAGKNLIQIEENGRILTPFKREPLEYLSIGVGVKKKNRRKHRGLQNSGERVESPLAATPRCQGNGNGNSGGSGRRSGGREFTPISSDIFTMDNGRPGGRGGRKYAPASGDNWNGSPMVIYNRNLNNSRSIRGRVIDVNGVEFHPNTVSQELYKLKKLDLSYAEVLRRAEGCAEHPHSALRAQRLQNRRNGNNINSNHRRQ
ncbi:uncharacterized protein Dwil_GK16349 [Drosophila willistoni]|uniref:Cerebellar degeneration-related protein 2-like n=1 Tax=Drosophila willistoni TaxID=7260 RepID=B4N1P8_DROWI|nr:uncharacterized protein LOC6644476 [Drosophila willistoni]EDW78287.1 uncharacterized protein Dwil_GK16349 [Drosophila willistoni]